MYSVQATFQLNDLKVTPVFPKARLVDSTCSSVVEVIFRKQINYYNKLLV